MSSAGAAPRAAVPISNARAEASRKNGAKSRGPKTPAGKARSALNALKHGMRAAKHVVLPDEDAVEFNALQALLFEELAPVGALQLVLARRIAVAAWRLARADRMEIELFAERRWAEGDLGLALIRDGNGTRSFETLLRYRGAAMAEFMRSLRTLKALQAEQAATPMGAVTPCPQIAKRLAPNEPGRLMEYDLPEPHAPGRALHEPAPHGLEPSEPESRGNPAKSGQPRDRATPDAALCLSDSGRALLSPLPLPISGTAAPCALPIEPETRHSGGFAPAMSNAARPARPRLAPEEPRG